MCTLTSYSLTHRPKSVLFATGRLTHVTRLLGTTLLPDHTETVIHDYMRTRVEEGVCGRTINMEVGELSRAIGHPCSVLWPKVRKMEEQKDVGKALSSEEEERLLEAIRNQISPNRSQVLGTFVRVALLTGMRSGEITTLTLGADRFYAARCNCGKGEDLVGDGSPDSNEQRTFRRPFLARTMVHLRVRGDQTRVLFVPFGKPTPNDPTHCVTNITSAWDSLRKKANVQCRLPDLRHTAATKMAEAVVPESTRLALRGHMSRAMLERYSHVEWLLSGKQWKRLDGLERTGIRMQSPQIPPQWEALTFTDL